MQSSPSAVSRIFFFFYSCERTGHYTGTACLFTLSLALCSHPFLSLFLFLFFFSDRDYYSKQIEANVIYILIFLMIFKKSSKCFPVLYYRTTIGTYTESRLVSLAVQLTTVTQFSLPKSDNVFFVVF